MSNLPSGWKETNLVDCLDSLIDYRGKTPKKSSDGILTLSAKSVKMGYIDYSQAYYISQDTYDAFMVRGFPKIGDVLMTTEAPLGCIARLDRDDVSVAQRLLTLRGKINILDNDYLLYYLTSRRGQHELNSRASGSTVQGIKRSEFEYVKIILPSDYSEQKAIANILVSFDKKIELLKEQNKTLETVAQTIFKEWFIDFNFPNATAEMIDSEAGKIPKGWKVFKLEELVNTVNGYSYKGKELVEQSNEALVTLKSFNRNGGFQTRGFKPFNGTPKAQQEVKVGDLVVAHTDLTQDAEVLGNPAFVFEDGGFDKMYITMDLVKVISKVEHIENAFLYYIMKDRSFKGHCIGYSNGTTVLHLSKKAIPEYKIALPENLKLAKEFSDLVTSFTSKISNNITQLQTLSDTRDKLLPKLMSGELRVEGFDS
jgi:type I restriction enzyme S subunit